MKGKVYADILKHTEAIRQILEKNNVPEEPVQAQLFQLIEGVDVLKRHILEVKEEDEQLLANKIYQIFADRSDELESKYLITPNPRVFPFGKTDNEKEIYLYVTKHNFLFSTYTKAQQSQISYSVDRINLKAVKTKNFRIKLGEIFNSDQFDKVDFLPEFGFYFEIIPSAKLKITAEAYNEINELVDDAIFETISQIDNILSGNKNKQVEF